MAQQTSFVPSGTVAAVNLTTGAAMPFAMPTVDGGNPDVLAINTGPQPLAVGFSSAPGYAVRPDTALLTVPAGAAMLLTGNATVLAAATGNPLVINTATIASAATAGSVVSAGSGTGGGPLTFQRGTATARYVF